LVRPKKQENMTTSARPIATSADLPSSRVRRAIFAASVLAIAAAPGAADARTARIGGGYDGVWSVLIITQAGSCDPAYSYPFQVSRGRISSNGPADVSGTVSGGGGVVVRISAAGAVATGTGRLGGGTGTGRWSARFSSGNCSGRWQATRG
jgi:hypothetical protein